MGSACPVSASVALTAGHVIDPRPFDPNTPLSYGYWSDPTDPEARHGEFAPLGRSKTRDLGMIGGKFPAWFTIASTAPKVGDWLTVQGFDWRKKSRVFAPRSWRVKTQYRAGQMLSVSENSDVGSSGACVLNETGEVVGIMAWNFSAEDGDRAGIVLLVYGETFEPEPEEAP